MVYLFCPFREILPLSKLGDVASLHGSAYCVGLTLAQNLEMELLNFTALNVDVRVKNLYNLDFKPCALSLSDAVGSLKDFNVGGQEKRHPACRSSVNLNRRKL